MVLHIADIRRICARGSIHCESDVCERWLEQFESKACMAMRHRSWRDMIVGGVMKMFQEVSSMGSRSCAWTGAGTGSD